MKAVFLDYASLDQNDLDFTHLEQAFTALILYPATTPDQRIERIQDADVVITNKVIMDADTIRQCPQLKLILIAATGTNNVDLVQSDAQNIIVCNCQAYGTAAVAQHTLMLMLNLATSFRDYDRAVQQGDWQRANQFCLLNYPIVELTGKTLGVVGYGELGHAVAQLATAFGMQILIAQLPHRPPQADRIMLDELLAQVDFLTLHCPLTDETRHLIDAAALQKMKKSAFLINCARGGIVNEDALADALRKNQIAGAAVDVLSVEPPRAGNVLLDPTLPHLIITPHSAWGSIDARQRIIHQLIENVQAFQSAQPLRQVNSVKILHNTPD
ncbi:MULTISPECIES: 2-hydroxyacid dehydrogenase [unclassified Acinetobacter]|uniref:2-hydroxyacid dehydrogenase n=1 Tax=unclassified Acinetobacter TaxID=196816 RepID=UPI0029341C78|nr:MULTISPECIES: 2-hydroxyacid dehydrogenase [unclassified Acinetobacter]WOE30573.1 2-hydroxyacid dehydrogenase [Acinetobacter sp. SAAs470]WOE38765.1 2-hydroxyacid dehydrogenase [Acinetobacter sp. SAAs474]